MAEILIQLKGTCARVLGSSSDFSSHYETSSLLDCIGPSIWNDLPLELTSLHSTNIILTSIYQIPYMISLYRASAVSSIPNLLPCDTPTPWPYLTC